MKKDYFTQLTRAARWLLPPEEAREVLAEYRDILDAAPRDDESLRRDLGGPVEAMRLVSQPKLYHRWLAAFAVMAACLLLPAAAPLPGGWRLWGFFQQFLYRFPVELMLLAAGLGVSLVWFRRREAGKEGPLPRGVTPLLALQLAGMAVAWSVLYLAAVQPQGPMDFLQAHAGLAGHIGHPALDGLPAVADGPLGPRPGPACGPPLAGGLCPEPHNDGARHGGAVCAVGHASGRLPGGFPALLRPPDGPGPGGNGGVPMLKKDLLELCLLQVLSRGDQYGYELLRQLHDGFPDTQESAVYALLRGLCRDGFTEQYQGAVSGGPARKYYRLTPAGAAKHAQLLEAWRSLKATLEALGVE